MALIKCPDCGKMFSEYAECCPECGCPTEDAKAANVGNKAIPQGVYEEESKKQASFDNPKKESVNKTVSQEAVQPAIVEDVAEKKKSNYRWLWFTGVFAILVIGGVFVFNSLVSRNKTSPDDLSEEESLEVIKTLAETIKKNNYDKLDSFHEGLAWVTKGEECGFINIDGEEVFPFDKISKEGWELDGHHFQNGLIRIIKGDYDNLKCGFINARGEEIIPCIYDDAWWFCEGFASVNRGGKYGFINTKGEEIVPCIYDDAFGFSEGLAMVKRGKYPNIKCGFINTKSVEVIPFIYDVASDFSEGLASVNRGGKYGFINTKGEEVIPCIYDYALNFSDGLAWVEKGSEYGFINTKGEEAFPFTYANATLAYFHEGLAKVRKGEYPNAKYGFINTKGEEIIPCIYDDASGFSEGLAKVRKGEYPNAKYGFINTKGEEVVPLKYDDVFDFSEGFGVVVKDDKYGYIDKYGHCTLDY